MRDATKRLQEPAIERARRVWKETTSDVYRCAIRRYGVASSWLQDHGGRPSRGVKAPDQLARLSREMQAVGFSDDQIDTALVRMVRGIAATQHGYKPAA